MSPPLYETPLTVCALFSRFVAHYCAARSPSCMKPPASSFVLFSRSTWSKSRPTRSLSMLARLAFPAVAVAQTRSMTAGAGIIWPCVVSTNQHCIAVASAPKTEILQQPFAYTCPTSTSLQLRKLPCLHHAQNGAYSANYSGQEGTSQPYENLPWC